MRERPNNFALKRDHSLAKGLVFAGLGCAPGSVSYRDSAPYDNHGTLTDMDPPSDWVWIPELGRWGLDFAGDNDTIVCPSIVLGSGNFTVSAWVYANVTQPSAFPTILSVGTTGAGEWMLRIGNTATNSFNFYGDAGNIQCVTSYDFPRGKLYHVCAVRTGGSASVWVDATHNVTDATASSNLSSTKAVLVGSGEAASNRWWAGIISDPLIHSRALSTPEIQQLADPSNAMLSGLIDPPRRKYYGFTFHAKTLKYLIFKTNNQIWPLKSYQ